MRLSVSGVVIALCAAVGGAASATLAASVTQETSNAQPRKPTPMQNAVELCEDGGGVGWWRPAKDLLGTVLDQIADSGQIAARPGDDPKAAPRVVRPPVRVSDVRWVQAFERVPRLCATFTETRARTPAGPAASRNAEPVKLLVTDTMTYCQISADRSWEGGLTKVLENLANGELYLTLRQETPVFTFDPANRTFAPDTGRRGERVRVGGRYITDVELLPHDDEPPSVCVTFSS